MTEEPRVPTSVTVIQADRDAVQAFHREMGRRLMSDIKNGTSLLDAKGDDSDPIYQAFARHRLSSTPALDERERLREARPGEFLLLSRQLKDQADFTIPHNPEDMLYRAPEILSALASIRSGDA